jgi:putative oxidoreductase
MTPPRWLWSPSLSPARPASALLVLRLVFGYHLLHYAVPHVLDATSRADFVGFLAKQGVPMPAFSGWLSIGAELLGGLSLVAGLLIRPACAVLVVNFMVALVVAHRHHGYDESVEALQMLAVVITLLGTGAGPLSVDALLKRRRS